jgi:hypothetical protein
MGWYSFLSLVCSSVTWVFLKWGSRRDNVTSPTLYSWWQWPAPRGGAGLIRRCFYLRKRQTVNSVAHVNNTFNWTGTCMQWALWNRKWKKKWSIKSRRKGALTGLLRFLKKKKIYSKCHVWDGVSNSNEEVGMEWGAPQMSKSHANEHGLRKRKNVVRKSRSYSIE